MVATSTVVAITAANSASASANAAVARRQADQACHAYMAGFDASTATQSQQIQYARCVERFAPMEESDVFGTKVFVLLAFVAVISGAAIGYLKDDGFAPIASAILGALMGLMVLIVGGIGVAGIVFVLS